jgi:hypothetical protein
VLTNIFGGAATDSVELGRFVLLDVVPGNGETWFLGRCYRELRRLGLAGVVSYSDPLPRTNADGRVVFPGHVGTIYQAHNAVYLGRATARVLRLMPDGTVFSERAISKIRSRERGWEAAIRMLVKYGAEPWPGSGDAVAWLKVALEKVTRKLTHPGNHKYAWTLSRTHKLFSLPYPKGAPGTRLRDTATGQAR